jgi:hypothetical protein
MIRLGAYKRGTDPQLDEAIRYYPSLEKFLSQDKNERAGLAECYTELSALLEMVGPESIPELEVNNVEEDLLPAEVTSPEQTQSN